MVAFFCPPPFMKVGITSNFVGITALYQASSTIGWPSETKSGDLAFIVAIGNTVVSVSGWTSIAGNNINPQTTSQTSFAFKVLSASDISSPPLITVPQFGAYYVVVYRGGSSITKKTTAASTANTVTVPGFTKSADSRLVICTGHDVDVGVSPTPPTGFVLRATAASQYFMNAVYDISSGQYSAGAVTLNLVAGGNNGRGTLLEIT